MDMGRQVHHFCDLLPCPSFVFAGGFYGLPDDDRLLLAFNCKDGTKTVTLAELEVATENVATGNIIDFNVFQCSYLEGIPSPVG